MVEVGGAGAVVLTVEGASCGLFAALLCLELRGQVGEPLLVLGEDRVHGQVDVAVRSYAAELLGDVVDHRLPAVVEVGLSKVPLLAVADHGVELLHSGNEGELRVLEDLGVPAGRCERVPAPCARCTWQKFKEVGTYPRGSCLNSVFFRTPAVHTRPSSLHLLQGNSPSHYVFDFHVSAT